jgi:AsmA protein
MRQGLKYLAYGVAGLLSLLAIASTVLITTFNPNDYKPQLIDLVQAKKNRTLKLDGDIKLAFWPKIGLSLGKASLSEHNSKVEFATVNNMQLSLALLPLLKKQLIVDTINIDGVRANLVQYEDGSSNFDDLLIQDESSTYPQFSIEGLKLKNSAITFSDLGSGARYSIDHIQLKTGQISKAQPINLSAEFFLSTTPASGVMHTLLTTRLLIDPSKKMIAVSNLKLDARSQWNGAQLNIGVNAPQFNIESNSIKCALASINLHLEKAGTKSGVILSIVNLQGIDNLFKGNINGEMFMQSPELIAKTNFSSSFIADMSRLTVDLPTLSGSANLKQPTLANLEVSFNLGTHADIKNELLSTDLNFNTEKTKLEGNLKLTNFKTPHIQMKLNANEVNLNKFLVQSKSNNSVTDLSFLENLHIDGQLNVGSLMYKQYQAADLKLNIKLDANNLQVSQLKLKLDDSQITGHAAISHYATPLYTIDLDIDKLDADKYLGAKPSGASQGFSLETLKALNVDGTVRIGQLKYVETKATKVLIQLKSSTNKPHV